MMLIFNQNNWFSRQVRAIYRQHFPNIFANRCLLCQIPTYTALNICNACELELPYLKKPCMQCAAPLRETQTNYCARCESAAYRDPKYSIFSPFLYQFPINQLISDLKFKRRLSTTTALSHLMFKKMRSVYQHRELPHVIVPVPLHMARLQARGFNQALELAKPISQRLSVFLDYTSCMRIQNTQSQVKLSVQDRATNVRHAFSVLQSFDNRRVCVIDDVLTTGNTTMALSHALFKAGAKAIDVWCCARATL